MRHGGNPGPLARASSRREAVCEVLGEDYDPAIWADWRWQVGHRITRPAQLERLLRLTPAERRGLELARSQLAVAVTPHYAALMSPFDPLCPLRRQVVPLDAELVVAPGDMVDPCGEDHDMVVNGLVHRYPDRVLLLALDRCAGYCRYCTRARLVDRGNLEPLRGRLPAILDYLRRHPEVRDVLVSGGDPLLMSDGRLDALLGALRTLPQIELLRIGSRVPCFLPQRITPELVAVLRRHRVWLSVHFSHPDEITPEVGHACDLLADGGIPMGSQTVLLAGINDDARTLKSLFHRLLMLRVRPYYLYQADPVVGTGHLRTSIAKGLEIMATLRGHTSGYAVPTYVVDAPGGGGKVPLQPETMLAHEGATWVLRNWAGRTCEYVDPQNSERGESWQ